MDLPFFKKLIKTKTFRFVLLTIFFYLIGFLLFIFWVNPDQTKSPGETGMWFRDLIWIVYWRYYLDWPMIIGFLCIIWMLGVIFRKLQKRIQNETIITYIFPICLMICNYIGMLAIDIAITWFADFYINGTWLSSEILLFNMTPQRLYHGFFFWFMPALIVIGVPLNTFLHTKQYRAMFKQQFVLMAGFFWCLGALDPVVCQVIWNDWQIFGTWAMMGYDPMWAIGWISHYFLMGICWLVGSFIVERIYHEIILSKNI